MSTERSYDIFLAHSGADTARAEVLYSALSPRHSVFLDSRCLVPGDLWDVEISRALRASQVIALLLSNRTESSYYVQEEIAVAIELLRREEGRHRVVPIYLDGGAAPPEVPYGVRRLHGVFAAEGDYPGDVAAALERALDGTRERGPDQDRRARLGPKRAVPLEADLLVDGAPLPIFENDRIELGRFPKTGVIVDHPSVSRTHLAITLSRVGLLVADLGSKNGTFVNGERVNAATLRSGDVVRLGRSGPEVQVRRAPVPPGPTATDVDDGP